MSPINGDDKKIGPAIGIDLGTWKCCVAVLRDGKVEVIENERGSKTTPSYVAFTKTERIIGEDAKSQVALNPSNTVYGVKRIIGRRFDDPSLQDIKDTFPFTMKQHNGKPFIEVTYKGEIECLCPEQVTAMLLTKMKRIAESHLGCEVIDAVISVPAYFNNAQRQATKDAGIIAGLNVLELINEPTAAALAYRDNNGPTDETICIVDLGGGTVDVSVIRMEGEKGITVVETHGNSSIGGMDFDQRLVNHLKEEFLTTSNNNISGDLKALERLRLACEKLKHTLSLLPTIHIQLDCLAADTDLESSIARDTFEELCNNDFTKSLYSVLTNVLQCSIPESGRQHFERFNRVVLVGGSTRIPYIQKVLKKVLHKNLDKSVNPDEAVAHGAAIKAALLGHETSVQDVAVRDVTTHAFVMKHEEGREVVFKQNSHERQKTFAFELKNSSNALHYFSECLIDTRTNTEISRRPVGSIKLSDCTRGGHSQFDFTINNNGIFCGHLVVEEGLFQFLFDVDHLNTANLSAMKEQEKRFYADEENEKSRLIFLSDLEAYCFNKKPLIEELSASNREIEQLKQKFIYLCNDTIDWLDDTPEATKDMCKTKQEDLEDLFNILVPPSQKTKEINMNIKQPPKTVYQRAVRKSSGNNFENAGGHCSNGHESGKDDIQDSLRCNPTAKSRSRQQTSQDREILADGLHHKNKKKKLDDQMELAAQTSGTYKSCTIDQNPNVPQQKCVTGPWRYYKDECLSSSMQFSENHFAFQPGSSVDPRARQATGLPAGVHKPGRPTASGAISANIGHHGRYSQEPGRHQQTASKHDHRKPSRERGKNNYSSYEINPDFSCDEEQPEEGEGYVTNRHQRKQSENNLLLRIAKKIKSGFGSAISSVTSFLF